MGMRLLFHLSLRKNADVFTNVIAFLKCIDSVELKTLTVFPEKNSGKKKSIRLEGQDAGLGSIFQELQSNSQIYEMELYFTSHQFLNRDILINLKRKTIAWSSPSSEFSKKVTPTFAEGFLKMLENITNYVDTDFFEISYEEDAPGPAALFLDDPYFFARSLDAYLGWEKFLSFPPDFAGEIPTECDDYGKLVADAQYIQLIKHNLTRNELLKILRAHSPQTFENKLGGVCLVDDSLLAGTFEEANALEKRSYYLIPFFIRRELRRKGIKIHSEDDVDTKARSYLNRPQDASKLGLISQETADKLLEISKARHISHSDVKNALNEQERVDFGLE